MSLYPKGPFDTRLEVRKREKKIKFYLSGLKGRATKVTKQLIKKKDNYKNAQINS